MTGIIAAVFGFNLADFEGAARQVAFRFNVAVSNWLMLIPVGRRHVSCVANCTTRERTSHIYSRATERTIDFKAAGGLKLSGRSERHQTAMVQTIRVVVIPVF